MTPAREPGRVAMLRAIRDCYEHGHFVVQRHFEQRMDQRAIPHSVLPAVFESAEIKREPEWDSDHGNWRVSIDGVTPDDERVRLGLALDIEDEILYMLTAHYID